MNNPIKHHYVHESYQQRFFSKESKLYVILKDSNYIVKETTPARICYIPHLNTLVFKGEAYAELERFYGGFEGKVSELLKHLDSLEQINKGDFQKFIEEVEEVQFILKLFISIMFWRNPKQNLLALKLIDNVLDLYDKSHVKSKELISFDKKTLKFLYKKRSNENTRKILQYYFLPLFTFRIFDGNKVSGYFFDDKGIITCDNPVYHDGTIDQLFMFERFLFPLDSGSFLSSEVLSLNEITIKNLNDKMILNSNKYIIGGDRECLEAIAKEIKPIK
ncbi:hypothetical protein F993_01534 [Acinetobacter proteolyticus]|uniref:DUF4238 domain-containing protein n=1 Tax=Acinetobacter proteolyticus TaxID=1776741 RepID=A0ABP2TPB1_9GAMM|nr:DUF4238 domain-containing protein [Acinetobacter proteolyticus]ENU24218.1 hypothetical protein F993_01534 [Acinetobacter proteolyticus]